MDKNFESELSGSSSEAISAKQQIAKYFKCYGHSGHQEARKHQLVFASKIIRSISKCEKHLDVYCNIITEVFADQLCPEACAKYWTMYVNCMRVFHYLLVHKHDFEKASLVYRHISFYNNKLQNTENSLALINIYCYQLFLQNSLKSKNPELAISEATDVLENLTKLFYDILNTNKEQKFKYPDVLEKSMSWLFPQNKVGAVYQFFKHLPEDKVRQMFDALFTLYGRQTMDLSSTNEADVQEHAKFIIETIYTLLQMDIMNKMQLQLSVQLLGHCRTECRLQSNKTIAEFFLLFYDYLKLLCAQKTTPDFQRIYSLSCERFNKLFEKYSKNVMNQPWFGDYLVLIYYLHSQLQNLAIFCCFWNQMHIPDCFKSMFQFLMELMKLAPCISAETKLFTTQCCTSSRKHVILSFAQIALAGFVLYCQNVKEENEKQEDVVNRDSNLTDYYKEAIQNNIILIINHALKIIDKMECITSNSQEIEIILTRFKQATLSCKTYKQARTCVSICELFLKIKTKIASKEWPLLLRRLYKTTNQYISDDPHVGRDIQMCYITSMLNEEIKEIDIGQIRTQISIFYANETSTNSNIQPQQQENCLLHLYNTTTSLLRPHLEPCRKKFLHWLESQHIIKYYKSNTTLLHSLLKSSQSYYDFVLITKLAKLQTYAVAKISSLYKSLKTKAKEMGSLTRLEQLTFGHVCVMLLNDINSNQKFQVDSKDLNEDLLENLLMREEMSTFTIYNDLKRFNLAWEAFKAFKDFYEKFDSELISMDDGIIDWESLLDDLASLALCLQLSGYMEQSLEAWLLHYKCSRLIQNGFASLRGLAFFCEYSEHFEQNKSTNNFKLEEEIQNNYPTITQGLENLVNLPRQAFQSYILLAMLQIAHYYARSMRFSFAQMLIQYVEQKHAELPERRGRYDIVLATMDAIKFRLLWKHFDDTKADAEENNSRTIAENILLHRCLLHEIENTLDRFHNFSYISSCDGLLYSILIIGLIQELAECTANRLCDNFINALFIATCKCTLLLGLALRFVQVMSMWMWVNLQMEYVDRAQTKLKLIEYVMGIKSLKELTAKSKKSLSDIQSSTLLPAASSELLTINHHTPGMEAIRKLAQVQLSPIKADKLQLSPSHHNSDLKRYLECNIDRKLMPKNEQIEWTFFMVGCLNARLYFLVEDYDQLETFYEKGSKWLQMCQNTFNKKHYKNMQLMGLQHYANFLRSRRQYDKALQCLEYGMELCENKKFYIDAVYYVNYQLQLNATKKDMNASKNVKIKHLTHSKPRRALQFNILPESKEQHEADKKELKEKKVQNVLVLEKNPTLLANPLPGIFNENGLIPYKRTKTQTGSTASSSSSSSSYSLDIITIKPKQKFQICEDSIEILDIGNVENELVAKKPTNEDVKATKRIKIKEENERLHKTPKVARNPIKSSQTTGSKPIAKIKRPEHIPQFHIDIDLTDSPSFSSVISKSSSLENLNAKENLNTNELLVKMQNLYIKNSKSTTENETKTKKFRRNQNLSEDDGIIVLEDSPCKVKPAQKELLDKPKTTRTRTAAKDKPNKDQTSHEDNLASISRPRRQRKLVLDKNEPKLENEPHTACLTPASTVSVTRRRQKKLV